MPARAFTEDQVREILTTPEIGLRKWAKRLGVWPQAIAQVRAGHVYKNIWHEVRAAQLCLGVTSGCAKRDGRASACVKG